MKCPICEADMARWIQSTPSGLVIKDECKCGYSTLYYEGIGNGSSKDHCIGTTGCNNNRRSSDLRN